MYHHSTSSAVENSSVTLAARHRSNQPLPGTRPQRSVSSSTSRKRRRTEALGERGSPIDPVSGTKQARPQTAQHNFACSYWKGDPHEWMQCYNQKLDANSRVKQHLNRTHGSLHHCPRCGEVFESIEERDTHLQNDLPCANRPGHETRYLSDKQKEALKKRADSKLSPEDQWFAIWDVVHPNKDRPVSPYVHGDVSEDLSAFLEHSLAKQPEIIGELYTEWNSKRQQMFPMVDFAPPSNVGPGSQGPSEPSLFAPALATSYEVATTSNVQYPDVPEQSQNFGVVGLENNEDFGVFGFDFTGYAGQR